MVRKKCKYIIGDILGVAILVCILYVLVIKCRDVGDVEHTIGIF
jgi:hypothetical protein